MWHHFCFRGRRNPCEHQLRNIPERPAGHRSGAALARLPRGARPVRAPREAG